MTTLADLPPKAPKILLVSPAGGAKTAFALTLGKWCEYLDLDDNLGVANGLKDNLFDIRQQVNIRQFLNENPFAPRAAQRVKEYVKSIVDQCFKGKYPFKAVVFDSLTSYDAAVQMDTMGGTGNMPKIKEWGIITNEIWNLIVLLKTLPIPVVFLAHEMIEMRRNIGGKSVAVQYNAMEDKKDVEEGDEYPFATVAITGQKLPPKIIRMFSEIWMIRMKDVGQGKTDILLQTVPSQYTNTRSGSAVPNNFRIGTIDKDKPSQRSVSMWEVFDLMGWPNPTKEIANATV